MKNRRKHGEGEYIIIKKWSNATETQIRYKGKWVYDIFTRGSIEDENGAHRELNENTYVSLKSKYVLNGKMEKNQTIKMMAEEMERKKSANLSKKRNSNASCLSILDILRKEKDDNGYHTIKI